MHLRPQLAAVNYLIKGSMPGDGRTQDHEANGGWERGRHDSAQRQLPRPDGKGSQGDTEAGKTGSNAEGRGRPVGETVRG